MSALGAVCKLTAQKIRRKKTETLKTQPAHFLHSRDSLHFDDNQRSDFLFYGFLIDDFFSLNQHVTVKTLYESYEKENSSNRFVKNTFFYLLLMES